MVYKDRNYDYIYYKLYSHKYKFYYEKRAKKKEEIDWEKETNYYYNYYISLLKKTHTSKINSS